MEKAKIDWPDLGEFLKSAEQHREEWLWDGVVPKNDITLMAAYWKKGKTTLLTGLVNALLRKGHYCGRGTAPVRRVLYLAPEEGYTLAKRFRHLGLDENDASMLTVVPRSHRLWATLVTRYRLREWSEVTAELASAGFDVVVLDGLHTMLQLFEPLAKEDNESVTKFTSQFLLPFGDRFTVLAALHTKKQGRDPRSKPPPEEMIRGASAWGAHPGQILVIDHNEKTDVKTFHCFGRYDDSTAQGMAIRYNSALRDYASADEECPPSPTTIQEATRDRQLVFDAVKQGNGGATFTEIRTRLKLRAGTIRSCLGELESMGWIVQLPSKTLGGRTTPAWTAVQDLDDPG